MSFPELPAHLDPLHSEAEIDAALLTLGAQLDTWALAARAETGRHLLAVCLLRGGVFFFTDVLLRMKQSVEPAFCRAWSYLKTDNGQPMPELRMEWQDLDPSGRDVVLIDNICDSGRTLKIAAAWLRERGAVRVRTMVIVHRERADSQHRPDAHGFVFSGKEWLVGYGLRDRDSGLMNTRFITTVRGSG